MRSPLLSRCGAWIPLVVAVVAIDGARRATAQAGGIVPPNTYEVQIDGESFLVDGNQPPVKVKSGLKKGTTYALAVRMAMTQKLRLNSVQLEYGMVATAYDNQGRDLRVARIVHDLGFSMEIRDFGQELGDKHEDELLKTLADDAVKRLKDNKAGAVTQSKTNTKKFGVSNGKWSKIGYTDAKGVARSCIIFVLSGEKYTVSAVAEYQDQYLEDVGPWMGNILASIRPKAS